MIVDDIVSVAYTESNEYFVNDKFMVPNDPGNEEYQIVQEWIGLGNTPDPYVPPPAPTVDDLYDDLIQQQRVLRALIDALNDGSFVPGSNYTNTQIKNGLKNRL